MEQQSDSDTAAAANVPAVQLPSAPPSPAAPRRSLGLILVGVGKLLKAALLLVVAAGLHRLMLGDASETVTRWMEAVRVDPESRYARALLATVTGISPRRLHELRIGTILYGLLFAVEGSGLLLGLRWAEYLTIVSTAGFLPLEAWELYEHFGPVKLVVTLLNVAVVVYLLARVVRTRRE